MSTVARIRTQLAASRALPEGPPRDQALTLLMADALAEERRVIGHATAEALRTRYGFAEAELDRHRRAALDEATRRTTAGDYDVAA